MKAQTGSSKAKWAKATGVSRSGYYTWRKELTDREVRQKALVETVDRIFTKGKGHYGAERVCGVIRLEGGKASFSKVKRVMDEHGWISSHCIRRSQGITNSRKARSSEFKNLVKGLKITQAFQVLASDITQISTPEGSDYLCQIRDVCTNIVVGFAQQSHKTADIVLKALRSAQGRWDLPKGAIFHSDRGSQYTAKEVMKEVSARGFQLSFSGVGKPGDNSWSESFFSILKKEIIHKRPCASREEARQRVFEYIETYYNTSRVQKSLGYLSPLMFLRNYQAEFSICVP
jgi:putative transposase